MARAIFTSLGAFSWRPLETMAHVEPLELKSRPTPGQANLLARGYSAGYRKKE